jgi:hypothetical protein
MAWATPVPAIADEVITDIFPTQVIVTVTVATTELSRHSKAHEVAQVDYYYQRLTAWNA